jgi:catalase
MPDTRVPDPPPVTDATNSAARLALVGLIVLSVGGAFSYVGGWLSPRQVTQARLIDEFERINGVHAGFRRNHAKGVGFSGYFESNGAGARLSKAAVFQRGRAQVVGRFSIAGGRPQIADADDTTRSMALSFALPHGEEWRTGMNNMPVFVANTGEAFFGLLSATSPDPKTGKPNPESVKAFLAAHPETARALTAIKAHTVLAFSLFFAFVAHLGAVLYHTLVLHDGLLRRMLPWRSRSADSDRS